MYRKCICLLLVITNLTSWHLFAQHEILNERTAEQFKEKIEGQHIEVVGIELTCPDTLSGTYTGNGELGIDEGIVLAINHTDMIFSGYDSFNVPNHFCGGFSCGLDRNFVDSQYMTPMIHKYWYDVPEGSLMSYKSCALIVDFVPFYDSIELDFVFTDAGIDIPQGDIRTTLPGLLRLYWQPFRFHRGGGNVLNEYTLSPYCDIIGMFLHKKNDVSDTVNLAVYPDEDVPVNYYSLIVDTPYVIERGRAEFFEPYFGYPGSRVWWPVAQGGNRSHYLRDNTNGTAIPEFNYGRFTHPIKAKHAVDPCDTFRLVIGVAGTFNMGTNPVIPEYAGSALFVTSISSFGSGDPTDCNPTSNDLLGRFEHVIIYPNPATDQVTISGLPHKTQVSLADVMGRNLTEVQSRGSSTTIHTADYPAGVYFLQFKDDAGHTGQAKFVIGE